MISSATHHVRAPIPYLTLEKTVTRRLGPTDLGEPDAAFGMPVLGALAQDGTVGPAAELPALSRAVRRSGRRGPTRLRSSPAPNSRGGRRPWAGRGQVGEMMQDSRRARHDPVGVSGVQGGLWSRTSCRRAAISRAHRVRPPRPRWTSPGQPDRPRVRELCRALVRPSVRRRRLWPVGPVVSLP